MNKTISVSQIKEVVREAYEQFKDQTGGKNADYIPYLAGVDKNLFGISICLLDGKIITLGDSSYRFGIESVSKVHTAILALRQYGSQKLFEMIGADATGLPFNSIMAILLEKDHPSTPLVNAGAITACSMIQPLGDSAKKWEAIVSNITDLSGSAPQLIDELYKSETATNFNNRSIAWLLKNYDRIYDDPDKSRKTKCAGREKRNAYFGAKTKSDSKVPIVTFSFGLFNQNISVIQTAFKRYLNGAFSFDFLLK